MPWLFMSRACFGRRSTPLVPSTTVKPCSRPSAASSKMSGRRSGSPPVRIRNVPGFTRAMSAITRRHSSVESSPAAEAPGAALM